jgi:hypothetical protein
VNSSKDPLAGEFAFNGIPASFNAVDSTFQLVVTDSNYERFQANISFVASFTSGALVDTVYNRIGNVYLFPLGTSAPSYTFTVLFNNTPVPNAAVQLNPLAGANVLTTSANSTLADTSGYIPALSQTTGTNGQVTFPGSSLALGAAYYLVVPPLQFQGVELAGFAGPTIYAGLSATTQVASLSHLAPTSNPYGLYVSNITNSQPGVVVPTGNLTITFSTPVNLNNGNDFYAFTTGSGTFAVTPGARVAASLSPDGTNLTLAPIWATPPASTDVGTTLTYATFGLGAATVPTVSPKGYPGVTFDVFALTDATGAPISGTVILTGP